MSGSSVEAVPGDVVTAIFIILDLNEKTGWTERNTGFVASPPNSSPNASMLLLLRVR
jgi:hypothetical protein